MRLQRSFLQPFLLAGALLGSLAAAQTDSGGAATSFQELPPSLARYETLEFTLSADAPADPYNPKTTPVVTFASPDGETLRVPAFWYQDFNITLVPEGEPHWRVRFTPTQAGAWTASSADETRRISVTESPSHGFLRVDRDNPRYLAFDDGTPFFAIGLNLGWATSKEQTLADYERWLDALANEGANTVRVWMASWSFGLEWRDTGLGDYTGRLDRAWLLDQVFRMAEARGVKIILVLLNHGAFSETTNPEWADNPYNAARGGPCAEPQCFVTDERAKNLFKRRLHYIAARWGHSPSLLAWEWWNEVNWTPITADRLQPWIAEMTAYLREVDVYRHLTTHSYGSGASGGAIWGLPGLDLMQQHGYTTQDPTRAMPLGYAQMEGMAEKPILYGEFGYSAGTEDETSFDREGVHLHNSLWAAALSGYASTGMYWWWDTYVEPLELWGHFGGISRFLDGEDLAALEPTEVELASSDLNALSLQSPNQALVWVQNSAYTADSIQDGLEDALREALRSKTKLDPDWHYEPTPVEGQTLTLRGLDDGSYQIRWYDPQAGVWQAEAAAETFEGRLTVTVPPLTRDLAFKLAKQKRR